MERAPAWLREEGAGQGHGHADPTPLPFLIPCRGLTS